ncbi:phosphoethanolamine transferase domain-containing protein [Acerihabitans sp. KWT182]|uniref:Phosphoethanolamine transferase domain-containing protein n=1 Tax=Acerihabitans sp. KWT182 TaxID=3157919 RepID=A0AAU7Q5Z4_9GAMM
MDISQPHNLLFFLSMPVTVLFTLNFIFSFILLPYIRKPIVILLLVSDALAQYFMLSYGVLIDRGMVQNIVDTTPAESFALFSPQLVYYLLVLGVLPSLVVIWLKVKPAAFSWQNAGFHLLNILISLCVIALVATFFYKDYASLMRNNPQLIKNLVPSDMAVGGYSYYKHDYIKNMPFVQIGLDAHKTAPVNDNQKKFADCGGWRNVSGTRLFPRWVWQAHQSSAGAG